ncbi:hypothetical protein F0562_025686 [Nyssa sinensis]|uniref:Uncharacterized protein n=1 Tax=Nyssa sinensis TaxID=561372 RepID=A0A5J5B8Q0_9ASTE|nr:hypothetical protein F0562_025686 [Nyssa sinensis]
MSEDKSTEFPNWRKQKVSHCGRSKSFVRFRHEMFSQRDSETQQQPSRIQVWQKTHYNPVKGWSCSLAKEMYDEMIALQSQPTPEGSTPLMDDDICDRVLGTGRGYIRGLGHGSQARVERLQGLADSNGGYNAVFDVPTQGFFPSSMPCILVSSIVFSCTDNNIVYTDEGMDEHSNSPNGGGNGIAHHSNLARGGGGGKGGKGGHAGAAATGEGNGGGSSSQHTPTGTAVIPIYAAGAANSHRNNHHSAGSCNRSYTGLPTLVAVIFACLLVHVYLCSVWA